MVRIPRRIPALVLLLAALWILPIPTAARGERPPSPAPARHAVLIIVDSVPGEHLTSLILRGELPNLRTHLFDRGLRVRNAVTTYPSTSFAVHAGIMTGALTNRHNITGLRWFDRRTMTHRSYAGPSGINMNADIPGDLRVFYELLPGETTLAVGVPVHRGASRSLPGIKPSDKLRMGDLRRAFDSDTPPRFAAAWLLTVDMATHRYGPYTKGANQRIRDFDHEFGRLVEVLQKRGLYESTLLCLTSDHGQMPVEQTYCWRCDLKALGFDPYDNLLFNATPEIPPGYNSVYWSWAVAMSHFWLPEGGIPAGVATTDLNWSGRPGLLELRHYPIHGRQIDLVDFFTRGESVQFVLARGDEPDTVEVFGDEGRAELRVRRAGDSPSLTRARFQYRVIEGEDPLGLHAYPEPAERMLSGYSTADQWFEATAGTDMPDAPLQIAQMMLADRTGDLVIQARDHWELHPSWHQGRHGGYTRDEMVVPLLFAGPGVRAGELDRARSVDIYPTLARALGIAYDPDTVDGQPLDIFQPADPLTRAGR